MHGDWALQGLIEGGVVHVGIDHGHSTLFEWQQPRVVHEVPVARATVLHLPSHVPPDDVGRVGAQGIEHRGHLAAVDAQVHDP